MSRIVLISRVIWLLVIVALTTQHSTAQSTCSGKGDPRSTVKACTEIIDSSPDADRKGVALVYRAYALLQLKDYDGALADTQLLKTLSPETAASYELAGVAYFMKSDWQQAVTAFDETIRRGTRKASIFLTRGRSLSKLERHGDAIRDFNAALQIDPGQNDVYGHRANAYSKLKQFDKALPDINYAIWAEPQNPILYLVRTEVLWNKGDLAGARKDLEKVLTIDPQNFQAKALLATLNLLTSAKKN